MYRLRQSGKFKKDVKLCIKRGYNLSLLAEAMKLLEATGELPSEYLPHPLIGKKGVMDAHIKPDWVLLWKIECDDDDMYEGDIILVRTGTHSDLFK